VASAAQGAFIHELTHALGMPHDFRSDANYRGNLMGNGLRGLRGCFHPAKYRSDTTRLSTTAARLLNSSCYFNGAQPETVVPTVVRQTTTFDASTGKLHMDFNATDASGLASAMLTLAGDLVADVPLSGTNAVGTFTTSSFTVQASQYQIFVYDIYGNRRSTSANLTPPAGTPRGPNPSIKIANPIGLPGDIVTLDASASTDPAHSQGSLTVRWDLDGDGVFDTAPTTSKTFNVTLHAPGTRMITAEITKPNTQGRFCSALSTHRTPCLNPSSR
ncbi:MAG TPA: hypothetical protein VF585_08575, partial [Chthoniobacterales bacterium]